MFHRKRIRINLQNLTLLLVSFLFILVLTNLLYVAFFKKEAASPLPIKTYTRRSTLEGLRNEHIPEATTSVEGIEISINSYGFRDHAFSFEKPDHVCRIVALGDSFTFGQGVPIESTYSKQLEQLLNEKKDGDRKYEVLNAGVQGYNTVQEALVLRRRILPLKPNFLILGFTETNDPEIKSPEPFSIRKALGKASVLLKLPLIRYLGERMEQKRTNEEWDRFTREIYRPDGESWKLCTKALQKIRDLCEEGQIKLLVVLFPCLSHEDFYRAEREQLKETLRNLNMPFLETYPFIKDIPDSEMHISETDHHPSARVHRRFSELIFHWMQKNTPCGSAFIHTAEQNQKH